ncbi:D-ribose pyranase [Alicyclobacillus tolerans]|uniref:D-ribose pyranase n=1 Tax=Alicyclobacillus tolerans TaxID=90970 RepID=UPI001F014973|nr:D-ribose pyranase [Alicyclobacillus tolerans]MCF8566833.1 D-ribose pyranase [Alicyclobacillus tolerans]
MKKTGILNPNILSLLARVGHTDYITICDRGFPVPDHQERIDLSLVDDIPTVMDVLRAIDSEFVIDRVLVTKEMVEVSPKRYEEIQQTFPQLRLDIVSHLELKQLAHEGKGVIRTADTCPYANIMVVSG